MRRSHFEALTEALKGVRPQGDGEGFKQWCGDVDAVGKVYDKIFPRFSRSKFLVACGVPVQHAGPKGVRTRVLKQLLTAQARIERQLAMLVAEVPVGSKNGKSHKVEVAELVADES